MSNRKYIIIAGATSGLGKALCERFVAAGWRVGAAGRNTKELEALETAYPDQVTSARIDVCGSGAPEELLKLIDRIGGMDIYLHCPGILLDNPELDPEKEVRVAAVNAGGTCRMLAAAFRYFKQAGKPGRIVGISSVAGCRGLAEMAAYSASKAFCQTYMEALRQLADRRRLPIRVVDIRPGWTRTPLLDSSRSYLLEMDADHAADLIFKATLHARRVATIGLRWKLLTTLERLLPGAVWERLHLPLWKSLDT